MKGPISEWGINLGVDSTKAGFLGDHTEPPQSHFGPSMTCSCLGAHLLSLGF